MNKDKDRWRDRKEITRKHGSEGAKMKDGEYIYKDLRKWREGWREDGRDGEREGGREGGKRRETGSERKKGERREE